MVLVLLELVLFFKMGVEFKGEIFSNYSRRVKWQQVSLQELNLVCIMFWIDHFLLSTLVQWCGGRQGKMVVQ